MPPSLKPVLTSSDIERIYHHKPPLLPDGAAGRIEAILEEAERELNGFLNNWILTARRSN